MKDVENALRVVKRNIQILEDRSKNGRIDARRFKDINDREYILAHAGDPSQAHQELTSENKEGDSQ